MRSILPIMGFSFCFTWFFLAIEDSFYRAPKASIHVNTVKDMGDITINENLFINRSDQPGAVIYRTFETIKSFDEIGWHLRLQIPPHMKILKHDAEIVLLGGSFVQGDGLSDSQTLPYLLQKYLNEDSLNFSVKTIAKGGESFSNFFEYLLKDLEIFPYVLDGRTTKHFFYFHPNFHLQRAFVTYSRVFYQPSYKTWPHFQLSADEAKYLGSYEEVFPWRVKFFLFLKKLKILTDFSFPAIANFLEYLGLNHIDPSFTPTKHFMLLKFFGEELKKRYPGSTFTVIEFPFFEYETRSHWEEAGLSPKRILLTDAERAQKNDMLIRHDGHPAPKMIELIAPRIYSKILDSIGHKK